MPPTENVESTLIWYRGTESENFKHWVDSLQTFLKGEFCQLAIFVRKVFLREEFSKNPSIVLHISYRALYLIPD